MKQFTVQGTYIRSAQAIVTPLVTNVIIQGTEKVAKITISVNGNAETTLHSDDHFQFSRGMQGLIVGDTLTIRAYSTNGTKLEEQTYQIDK